MHTVPWDFLSEFAPLPALGVGAGAFNATEVEQQRPACERAQSGFSRCRLPLMRAVLEGLCPTRGPMHPNGLVRRAVIGAGAGHRSAVHKYVCVSSFTGARVIVWQSAVTTGDKPKSAPDWLVLDVAILVVGLALVVLGCWLGVVGS